MTNLEGEPLPRNGVNPTPLIEKYLKLDRDSTFPNREEIKAAYDYFVPNIIPLSVVDVPQFSIFIQPEDMPLDIATDTGIYAAGETQHLYRFLLHAGPNIYLDNPSDTMVTIRLQMIGETLFGEKFISIASLDQFRFTVGQKDEIPNYIDGSNSDLAGFIDLFEKIQQKYGTTEYTAPQ